MNSDTNKTESIINTYKKKSSKNFFQLDPDNNINNNSNLLSYKPIKNKLFNDLLIINQKKTILTDTNKKKNLGMPEYSSPIDLQIEKISEELELDKRNSSEIDNKKLIYQTEDDMIIIEKILRDANLEFSRINEISFLDIICFILKKNNKRNNEIEILKIFFLKIEKLVAMFKPLNVSINDMMGKLVGRIKYEKKIKNSILFKEGDKGDKFYIILKGEVGILIQQEKLINCTPIEYLKYLMILYLYTEKSLISKMIYANRDTINFDDKCFQSLMDIFKFYHFYKDYSIMNKEYKDVIDFIKVEHKINKYLNKKNDFISGDCFHLLDLSNIVAEELFKFYCRTIDNIKKVDWNEIVNSNLKMETFVGINNFNNPTNLYEFSMNIKSHQPDEKKLKSEEFFEKLYNINEVSNNLIRSCTVNEYIQRINGEEVIKLIRKDTKNYFIDRYEDKEKYKYYNYFEVNHLKDGNIFGELALINPSKKRTATVIIKEDCHLGVLNKEAYDMSIKNAQDKLRIRNLLFFTNGPIFNGIANNYFLNYYFFRFKKKIYNSGEILFHRGEKRNKIYFIISGELQLSAKLTLRKLTEIINYLNDEKTKDDGGLSKIYCRENIRFKRFYEEEQNNLRFYVLKDKEIAGLDDMTEKNIYLFDCKCVSLEPSEIYELDYNIFEEAVIDNPVKKNNETYVSMKKELLLQRLYGQRDSIAKNEYNRIKTFFINLNLDEIFKNEDKKNSENKNKTLNNFFHLNNKAIKKNFYSITDEIQTLNTNNTNFNNTILNNTNINNLINNNVPNNSYLNKKFPFLNTARNLSSYKSKKNKFKNNPNYNKLLKTENNETNLIILKKIRQHSTKPKDLYRHLLDKENSNILFQINKEKKIDNENNKIIKLLKSENDKNQTLTRIVSHIKNNENENNKSLSASKKNSKLIRHLQGKKSKTKIIKVEKIMSPTSKVLMREFTRKYIEPNQVPKNKNKFTFNNQKIFETLIKNRNNKNKKYVNITYKNEVLYFKKDNTHFNSNNELKKTEPSHKNKGDTLISYKTKKLNKFKNKMIEENYKDIFFIDCLILDKLEENANKNNEKERPKLRGKKLIQ